MRKHVVLVMLVLVSLLVGVTAVSAKVGRFESTFTETLNCAPGQQLPSCSPGEVSYPSGDRQRIRGMVMVYEIDVTDGDERFAGINIVEINANLDQAEGFCCGPMWGTFHNAVYSVNGSWQGTWTGKAEKGPNGMPVMHIKARGRGYGVLDGFQVRTVEHSGDTPGVIVGTAEMLELPSK